MSDVMDHEAAARAHFDAAGDLLGEHLTGHLKLIGWTHEPSGDQQDAALCHLRKALDHETLRATAAGEL